MKLFVLFISIKVNSKYLKSTFAVNMFFWPFSQTNFFSSQKNFAEDTTSETGNIKSTFNNSYRGKRTEKSRRDVQQQKLALTESESSSSGARRPGSVPSTLRGLEAA